MPTLLDPPTSEQELLLQTVATCFYRAEDQWPIWQYVDRVFADHDLDAEEVLAGMPVWKNDYGYLRTERHGGVRPQDNSRVQLTAAGIHHSKNGRMLDLLDAFVASVTIAARLQYDAAPGPTQTVTTSVKGRQLAELAARQTGVPIPPLLLASMLQVEPATWGGLDGAGGIEWIWHLEHVRLGRYRRLETPTEYLTILEDLVGLPPEPTALIVPTTSPRLEPTAIAEALDSLNATWQAVQGDKLFELKNAAVIAELTGSVVSSGDFQSRCSSLAIIFNWFTTARMKGNNRLGPLAGMQETLAEQFGDPSPPVDAVRVLRDVAEVRRGQQHREVGVKAEKASEQLGLDAFGGDWDGAWEHLQRKIVYSLRTIKTALQK